VYQLARELQREIFRLSGMFPRDELYSLTSQIRRASRSIGANIAEAWAKRRYPPHFASKLSDSAAECNEVWHWVDSAAACGYLESKTAQELHSKSNHIGAMLEKMIENAQDWCRTR
jgi:four helix bundle protein